ncbi:DUF4041 domain-containing protein [Alteromonas macleodii]|uniref:DUF4041 domain-containing protein n=1 Tax=Alteromonas macleodii TaxID=28108 RepID=UPI003D033496
MLGFVSKSSFEKERERANASEKKLAEVAFELVQTKKELSSSKYLRSIELSEIEKKISHSKTLLNSLNEEALKTKNDADVEAKTLLMKANEVSNEITKLAHTEAENIISRAKKERDIAILSAEEEVAIAEEKATKLLQEAEVFSEKLRQEVAGEIEEIKNSAEKERNELMTSVLRRADETKESAQKELVKLEGQKDELLKKIRELEKKLSSSKTAVEHNSIAEAMTPYQYLMNGPVSSKIKAKLEKVKDKQKSLILKGKAYKITSFISWNNNLASGKAMQKRHAKFLLIAFNAEVDNLISNTSAKNFTSNAKKIEKWFDRVNKNGQDSCIVLSRDLLSLRLEEQRYVFEHKYKKEMELEEQRYMRETLREEAKVKREIEKFVIEREKEEKSYQKDLKQALLTIETASQEQIDKLTLHIEELKLKLSRATEEKERALSMAQLTRSGYVYIISNKGSFGQNVYKIGMTRRLEPLDRVRELSGASVPFYYDVHALIPSDDAPSLENKLHNKFAAKRVNKVNQRREFFRLSPEDIENALKEFVEEDVNIIHDVVSDQYEETLLIEEEMNE